MENDMKKLVTLILVACFGMLSVVPASAGSLYVGGKADNDNHEVRVGLRVLGDPQPEFANIKGDDRPWYKKPVVWLVTIAVVAVVVLVGEETDWGSGSGDNRGNNSLTNAQTDNSDVLGDVLNDTEIESGDDTVINLYLTNGSFAPAE